MGYSTLALFNGCEAVLWMVLAAVIGAQFRTAERRTRRAAWTASVLLVAFGISDLIEIQTGAWWRPPELLILKALCLAGLAGLIPKLLRSRFANQQKMRRPGHPPKQKELAKK